MIPHHLSQLLQIPLQQRVLQTLLILLIREDDVEQLQILKKETR